MIIHQLAVPMKYIFSEVLLTFKDGETDRLLIICAGARDAQLTIYWVDDPDNDWTRTSRIKKNIIGKKFFIRRT